MLQVLPTNEGKSRKIDEYRKLLDLSFQSSAVDHPAEDNFIVMFKKVTGIRQCNDILSKKPPRPNSFQIFVVQYFSLIVLSWKRKQ